MHGLQKLLLISESEQQVDKITSKIVQIAESAMTLLTEMFSAVKDALGLQVSANTSPQATLNSFIYLQQINANNVARGILPTYSLNFALISDRRLHKDQRPASAADEASVPAATLRPTAATQHERQRHTTRA